MGSGKSTVGRLVAARAGVPHRDLDTMIEERCGISVAEVFATRGEAAFRALEAEMLPEALEREAVVSLGGGAVLSDDNWALIRERAVTIWLDVPLAVLVKRAEHGQAGLRPLLNGRSPDQILALFDARLPRYSAADHRVYAAGPPQEVAEEVYKLWVG